MRYFPTRLAFLLVPVLALVACERTRSVNPLSPAIAGPISGVSIVPPVPLQPPSGSQVASDQQPVTIVVQNGSTTGVRPLDYTLEISTDAAFTSVIFTQTGIAPDAAGRTTFRLPQSLQPERTYFWRTKAQDGANASGFSTPVSFKVYTPVIIQAPFPRTPNDGSTVTSAKPTLVISNSTKTGPAGEMSYIFEVATDAAMANKVVSVQVAEGSGTTNFSLLGDLDAATRFYWRARGLDPGHLSDWSVLMSFVTPVAAAIPLPAPPGGGGQNPNDAFDLSTATIVLGPSNIASWPVTSTVTSTTAVTHNLCISHTKLGQWPNTIFFGDPGTLVEGNQWVFANIGGKWYGGAADWYRPGQSCKDVTAASIGGDAFYDPRQEPLHSWVPRTGETIGLMDTTPARAWPDMRTLDQRTNVVLTKWGG